MGAKRMLDVAFRNAEAGLHLADLGCLEFRQPSFDLKRFYSIGGASRR
jgi:hypothetical protein